MCGRVSVWEGTLGMGESFDALDLGGRGGGLCVWERHSVLGGGFQWGASGCGEGALCVSGTCVRRASSVWGGSPLCWGRHWYMDRAFVLGSLSVGDLQCGEKASACGRSLRVGERDLVWEEQVSVYWWCLTVGEEPWHERRRFDVTGGLSMWEEHSVCGREPPWVGRASVCGKGASGKEQWVRRGLVREA